MAKEELLQLRDYQDVVGIPVIEELELLASGLAGKRIQMVTPSPSGSVAVMLDRMLPLLADLGLDPSWRVIRQRERFLEVAAKFRDALRGKPTTLAREDSIIFDENTERNLERMKLDGDVVFVYGHQPLGLVRRKRELGNKWVWACYTDASRPDSDVWDILQESVNEYDAAIFPVSNFAPPLHIRQFIIPPSVDPLSSRNMELAESTVKTILRRFGIIAQKPIVTQISPFEHLEDPLEMIEVFNAVTTEVPCQLVLAGDVADPEPEELMAQMWGRAGGNPDIHILPLDTDNEIVSNALHRASTIVVQQSLKEGFGVTVSEAMWKAKPVVASAGRGLSSQIKHNLSGLLTHSPEEMATAVKQLLTAPDHAHWLGKNAREWVKQNSLITRHLRDYLLLILSLDHHPDVVISEKSW